MFTIKYSMEISGVVGFSLGFTNVLGAVFAFLVVSIFGDSKSTTPSIVGYSVGAALNVLSIFFVMKESDEVFNYDDEVVSSQGPKKEKLI